MKFDNPDAVSSAGVSSDRIQVTFWSSSLLKGANGLPLGEGQSLSKGIVPQVDPQIAGEVQSLGNFIGISVLLMIAIGIIASEFFQFDSQPFWLFFNVWQLFMHIPLLNLKIPGFVAEYWRK